MARQQFEGRSAAEAAIKACEALGTTRSALRYDVVSETGEGLERRVVIAVDGESVRHGGSNSASVAPGTVVGAPSAGDSSYDRPERSAERAPDRGGDRGADRGSSGAGGDRGPRRDSRGGADRGGERGGGRDRGRRDTRGGDRGGSGGGDRGPRRDGRGGGRGGDRDRGPRRGGEGGARREQPSAGIEPLLKLDQFGVPGPARTELSGTLSERANEAKTVLNGVLKRMHFEAAGRIVQDDAQEIHLDITGADAQRVIGKMGEPLLSMQFLVNRMLSRELEGEQVVVLDVAGYRERRRAALAELAKKLAARALEEKKVVKLSPMSAHDRRVFHLTLTEVEGVTTQSEGEGLYRRLLIIPSEFGGGAGGGVEAGSDD